MPDSSNSVDFTRPKELENNKSNKEKGLEIPYMGRTLASFYHLAPKRNPLLLDCTCPYVNVDEENVFTKAERMQECFRRQRNKDIIAITFTGEFKACVVYPKSEGNPNLNWDRETWKGLDVQMFNSAEDVEIVTINPNLEYNSIIETIGEVHNLLLQLYQIQKEWSSQEKEFKEPLTNYISGKCKLLDLSEFNRITELKNKFDSVHEEQQTNQDHGRGCQADIRQGIKYEGEWKEGKTDGRRIYQKADGTKYEGEWKDNKRHRRGISRPPAMQAAPRRSQGTS